MEVNISELLRLSQLYDVPLEDILFIALNSSGINFKCSYNRMRMGLRLSEDDLFGYAKQRGELEYYFALPVNQKSAFVIVNDTLLLQDRIIGQALGPTEDICDSHYPRRKGTSLNINPNSRTSCRGCEFCYTAYQVSCDRKKLKNEADIRGFFDSWLEEHCLSDLSHLIQISIVTGCYNSEKEICQFLLILKRVLGEYRFNGKIFYLGSQIITQKALSSLTVLRPFGICFSLETFERRDLLRDKKRKVSLYKACEAMDFAQESGYEVNFSYIVGMEPLQVMEIYFSGFKKHINKFPTINILQMHKYHKASLLDPTALDLRYYLKARQLLESIFLETDMRPLVWEDYRSLWFLKFDKEPLYGIRTP